MTAAYLGESGHQMAACGLKIRRAKQKYRLESLRQWLKPWGCMKSERRKKRSVIGAALQERSKGAAVFRKESGRNSGAVSV